MRFQKGSNDYQDNIYAFYEMDDLIPMTKSERNSLRLWARSGQDIETNPWDFTDADGSPLNYLQAFRLKNGYSSGPWDYWKGPQNELYWDEKHKTFISKEQLW